MICNAEGQHQNRLTLHCEFLRKAQGTYYTRGSSLLLMVDSKIPGSNFTAIIALLTIMLICWCKSRYLWE